ncbi:MAG: hypothetical protein ACLFVP_02990 [Candidatus Bathyarchaeia archaeon]
MGNEDGEKKLEDLLQDEDYKELLNYCLEPKAWKEIRKLKIHDSKLFDLLKDLKKNKALQFSEGKYYTADFAKEYLA